MSYTRKILAPSSTVHVVVPEKDWRRLQECLNRPARKNSGIERLFSKLSIFETEQIPIKDSPG